MNKTDRPTVRSFIPPTLPTLPMPPVVKADEKRPVRHKGHMKGTRECAFTTMRFDLQANSSAWDTLTIHIDEHNGQRSSELTIRGQIEAGEAVGHLLWLADTLSRYGGVSTNDPVGKERVTFENSVARR